MVVTRRGASLLNQNVGIGLPTQSSSRTKRKEKRSRSRSSLSPPAISSDLNVKAKAKTIKNKKNKTNHQPPQPQAEPDHSALDASSNHPAEGEGNNKKKSLFGFNFDSSSIPVSNFNPTLCYDFSTSFAPSKVNPLNSVQSKPLNATSSLHQTTNNSRSNATTSIKPHSENDEFETMKSAIMTITQFLATSNDDPNHTLSIFEGIMADPVMRARVPIQLLRDYETALTQKPDCTKHMDLIDSLVAATGTATRIAKDLMRRRQQTRNSLQDSTNQHASHHYNHSPLNQITGAYPSNRGDPLTAYNLSQYETISPQISINQLHQSTSQEMLHQPQPQLGPPINLRQSNSNQDSGFDVQSVTPTVIEANPTPPQDQPSTSQLQPSTSQQLLAMRPQTLTTPHQSTQINNLQSILHQSTSMNLSSIQDPNSIEHQRLRKAKTTLTAIRLQSGEEEAKEVYAGFQLMVVYELIGILSTELWSDVYQKYLNETGNFQPQGNQGGIVASGSGTANDRMNGIGNGMGNGQINLGGN